MVSNPGTTLGSEMHELMGVLYRADPAVQKAMLGMRPPPLDEAVAFRSGLGGVRWFEGWPIRRQDSRGDGKAYCAFLPACLPVHSILLPRCVA
jgi:hypothetical protein